MSDDRRRWIREAPDVRRQQLLDAARQLIVERGFDATTMSDVAEAAGVGKGTVYLYFDSKVDLLDGLQALFWERMMTIAREAIDRRARSWRGRWRHLFEDLVNFGASEDDLFHALVGPGATIFDPHLVFSGSQTASPESDDVLVDVISDLLRRQQAAGAANVSDIEATSRFIASASAGMGSWLIHCSATERRARVGRMLDVIDRAIEAS